VIDPRQPRILLATLAVVGLLACGFGNRNGSAGAERQPDAALPDPCTLLTPEEVGEVQGGPTDPGEPASGRPATNPGCVFGQTDDPKLTTITVFAGDQARFQEEREVVEQYNPVEDIPGLGDAAFIGASVLHVRKGELIITLFVGSPTAEEEKAKAVKLAPKALARL
jgi:hypothetical protein